MWALCVLWTYECVGSSVYCGCVNVWALCGVVDV